jgi:hypothetical protein
VGDLHVTARCWVVRCACEHCKSDGRRDYYLDEDGEPCALRDGAKEFSTIAAAREALASQPPSVQQSHRVFRRGWRDGFVTRCFIVRHRNPTGLDTPMWVGGRSRGGGPFYEHTNKRAKEFKRERTARMWAADGKPNRPDVVVRRGHRVKTPAEETGR